jgi:hypothetical protein
MNGVLGHSIGAQVFGGSGTGELPLILLHTLPFRIPTSMGISFVLPLEIFSHVVAVIAWPDLPSVVLAVRSSTSATTR